MATATYVVVHDGEAEAKREFEPITALPAVPPKGFDNFEQRLSGTKLERELKVQGSNCCSSNRARKRRRWTASRPK